MPGPRHWRIVDAIGNSIVFTASSKTQAVKQYRQMEEIKAR